MHRQQSLRHFLQNIAHNKNTRYLAAFPDLNGDGQPEAIVYLISPDWCGSGGCSMFVLKQNGSGWKTVTQTTITQLPIRVLAKTSYNWHTLAVGVGGGGILSAYEAELRFDGKSYPRNPSVPPVRRLNERVPGETVISDSQRPERLYN